jgi:hypothetical protein
MTKRNLKLVTTALALILGASAALGQTADPAAGTDGTTNGTTNGATTTDPNAGAFQGLSPGGQKIARTLFDAQVKPAGDGTANGGTTDGGSTTAVTQTNGGQSGLTPWTLDQIAAAKQGTGWGIVFKNVQAEGLVDAKNLGQVVSRANRQPPSAGTDGGSGTDDGTSAGSGATTDSGAGTTTTSVTKVQTRVQERGPRLIHYGNGASAVVDGGRGGKQRGWTSTSANGSGEALVGQGGGSAFSGGGNGHAATVSQGGGRHVVTAGGGTRGNPGGKGQGHGKR